MADNPLLSMVIPTGSVVPFAGKSIPENWLLCDGRELNREEYSELFSVINTTYGNGNGSTTFNIPDMNGRFAECTTNMSELGSVEEAGIPNLKGTFITTCGNTDFSHNSGSFIYGLARIGQGDATGGGTGNYAVNYDASRVSSIYSNNSTTMAIPSISMYFIIKYKSA